MSTETTDPTNTPSVHAEALPELERTSLWRSVLHDRFVVAALGLLAMFVFLYYVPLVSSAWLGAFIQTWTDPILIPLVVAGLLYGLRHRTEEERTFWNLIIVSYLCFSGGTWLGLLFPDRPPRTDHVVRAVLFMAHFACIFLALSMNPHAGQQRHVRDMRRRLESYGTIAFCGLLIAYFVTTPVYQLQGALGSTARMSMYIALDVVLIFALMYSATYCRNRRWRLVYRFLAASVGCSFSTDAVELLIHTGRLPQIPYGTAYDFLWYLPYGFAVFAAAVARAPSAETFDDDAGDSRRLRFRLPGEALKAS